VLAVPSSGQGALKLDDGRLKGIVQVGSMLDGVCAETHSAHYIWCTAPVQATTGSVWKKPPACADALKPAVASALRKVLPASIDDCWRCW
jgi:hypothetical protein